MKLKFGSWSLTPYLMVVALVGLQACGGGGGSTTVKDANPNGYYSGSASVKTVGNNAVDYSITDLQIMINGNRIMMMSDARAILYDGTFTVSGNDLTSTVSIYYNGNKQSGSAGTATLNATVSEGAQITGSFTGTELGNGTFVSTYSSLNSNASSLSNIQFDGTSRAWNTFVNEMTSGTKYEIEIYSDTSITDAVVPSSGSLFQNCLIEKNISTSTYTPIVNTSLFAVKITFNSCNNPSAVNNGIYTGFSQYIPGTPNKIAVAITNGTYALTDDFEEL